MTRDGRNFFISIHLFLRLMWLLLFIHLWMQLLISEMLGSLS